MLHKYKRLFDRKDEKKCHFCISILTNLISFPVHINIGPVQNLLSVSEALLSTWQHKKAAIMVSVLLKHVILSQYLNNMNSLSGGIRVGNNNSFVLKSKGSTKALKILFKQ